MLAKKSGGEILISGKVSIWKSASTCIQIGSRDFFFVFRKKSEFCTSSEFSIPLTTFPLHHTFAEVFFVLSSTSKVFCFSPKYESSMADSSLNSRRRSFSYFHSQFCMKGNKAEFHFTFKNTSSSCLVISPWAEFTKSAAKIQSR